MFAEHRNFAVLTDLVCSDGEVAIDGTCVLPDNTDNTSDALGLPNGTVNDVVPSLNQGGSDLSKGGGIGDGGGASGGGGGGGGHGR